MTEIKCRLTGLLALVAIISGIWAGAASGMNAQDIYLAFLGFCAAGKFIDDARKYRKLRKG